MVLLKEQQRGGTVARLPIPGSDADAWGSILNNFLSVEHNSDGTHEIPGVSAEAISQKVSQGTLVFNVKDYGAKGDAKRLRGVSASSGGTTVTASDASFTSADIGKKLVVYSEDGAGSIRSISAVNSATQVTLNGSVGITVSGNAGYLVYGSDDTSAIASALNAAKPGGIDVTVGPNMPMGVGFARVLLAADSNDGGYLITGQLSVPSGVVLDSPAMVFNALADRYDPAIVLKPYAFCETVSLECLFGAGIQAGEDGAEQAHIRMGNLRFWHVGVETEGGGAQRSQDALTLLGYHFEIESIFCKGGVRTVYHNPGSDAIVNYAYAIGSKTGVKISGGNQIAYSKLFLDTCGPDGGGTNGVEIDDFASNISMDIQAFQVTGTAHELDYVVALGFNSTNVNKDIRLSIQANNTGGAILHMARTQEAAISIIGSNAQFPSGANLPITTAVVYGAGNTGINAVSAMLETSITPSSGTQQGTFMYHRLDATTFANAVTVQGEITATNTPSTDIYNGNAIQNGEELLPRLSVSGAQALNASGSLHLTYFTARKTEAINTVQMVTDATAASGVTLARMGIYSIDGGGNLTLVASTPNDTGLFGSSYSAVSKGLSASFNKVKGTRYAFGVLVVGSGMPDVSAILSPAAIDSSIAPRLNGLVAGQANLPASIAAGSIDGDYRIFQATMTP